MSVSEEMSYLQIATHPKTIIYILNVHLRSTLYILFVKNIKYFSFYDVALKRGIRFFLYNVYFPGFGSLRSA